MYLDLATGQVGIFIPSKFCWSGEIGRHIVFRTLRAQAHVGSSPASSTRQNFFGTHTLQKRMPQGLRVQISPTAQVNKMNAVLWERANYFARVEI